MLWLFYAAGAVVTASLLPHTRDKVKEVPWLPVAVAVGLGVLADSIKSIGTDSVQQFEIKPSLAEGAQYKAFGNMTPSNVKGVTLIKRKVATS